MLNNLAVLFIVCVVVIYGSGASTVLDSTESTESQDVHKNETVDGNIKIITVYRDNKEFLTQHPAGEHVEYLNKNHDLNQVLHYAIGARTSNDRLVASGGRNQSWPTPQHVNVQLTYPNQGFGAVVTYVAVVVDQSTNLGQAYVVHGGIKQRTISVVVEGYNTYFFNYVVYIYGI